MIQSVCFPQSVCLLSLHSHPLFTVRHLSFCYSCPTIRQSVVLRLSVCYPSLLYFRPLSSVCLSVIPVLLYFRPLLIFLPSYKLSSVLRLSACCPFPPIRLSVILAYDPSVCFPSSVQYIYYPCPPIRLPVFCICLSAIPGLQSVCLLSPVCTSIFPALPPVYLFFCICLSVISALPSVVHCPASVCLLILFSYP